MGGILLPQFGTAASMGYVSINSIPSLTLWYNASASSTLVSGTSTANFDTTAVDGTAIGTWNDLSGTGHPSNAQGGAAKKPIYKTPIQNNLGAIFYNSTIANNLDINPASWSHNLSGITVYVIARPTILPNTVFPLVVSDSFLGIWWNGANWTLGHSSGNFGVASPNPNINKDQFHIYGFVFDGTATGNANRLQFRYDKTIQTLNFTGTIGATTGTPSYWFFGGDNRGSAINSTFTSKYMDGYMGEVMIWTRALARTELSLVENYLTQKWGLTSNTTITSPSTATNVTISALTPFSTGQSYTLSSTSPSTLTFDASPNWALGTGDFTIEWFQYQTDSNAWPRIFAIGSVPSTTIGCSIEGGIFYVWCSSAISFGSVGSYKNQWVHFAIVRLNNTLRVYKNGIQLGSDQANTTNINNTTEVLTIGNETASHSGAQFGGQITNFRWTTGLAVYTGNFTTPTSALQNTQSANPYGGSNTVAIPRGYAKLLLVP